METAIRDFRYLLSSKNIAYRRGLSGALLFRQMIQSPGSGAWVARIGETSGMPGSLFSAKTFWMAPAMTVSIGRVGGVNDI
jgi:hypothetical protein